MKHVVVGIITKNDTEPSYLLVSSNKDFGEFSRHYYPPGGHIKEGENELFALKREIREELSLEVTSATKITDTESDVGNQKTSWYLCRTLGYDYIMEKKELHDAGFFTEKDMKSMKLWPATENIFRKYIFPDHE